VAASRAARRERVTEATEDFDAQLAALEAYSPYLVSSRGKLIARLREELPQRAEPIDLRALVKAAEAER
jgi:hypothetical protein